MRTLILYDDYSREEVHDIFASGTTFTPQAGTWGLQQQYVNKLTLIYVDIYA